jgi:protocatechuate 3,4-dioxygenase beta subunit
MHKVRIAFLPLVFLIGFADYSNAEDVKKITCSGKVVDSQKQPLAGVKVGLYKIKALMQTLSYDVEVVEQITTKDDGGFVLEREASDDYTYQFTVFAEKKGLAIGWANWHNIKEDIEAEITLTKAEILAGKVVDGSGGPIGDVDITIFFMMIAGNEQPHYLVGKASDKLLATKTNANGEFTFNQIPAGATAEFIAQKPGFATVTTFEPTGFSFNALTYSAGQKDIKIEIEPEAKIEGIVVEKGTDKPVSDIQLMARQGKNQLNYGYEPVVSNADGTFIISALAAGVHIVQIVASREELADWIAETVEVTTEAGKTQSGIKIEASKGGMLEVSITNAEKKPVEKASVSVHQEETDQWLHCRSDKDGLAKIRLLAGDYQMRGVHKEGYSSSQEQNAITIQENETVRIDIELAEAPKITGTVRDDAGKPVEGASVKMFPGGSHNEVKTDTKGRFDLAWDPGRWGSQQSDTVHCLVVRHTDRNLAAVQEVEEDTKTVDIKLAKGVVFSGVVVDTEGEPIAEAKITVMLRMSRWGSSITDWRRGGAVTDAKGKFEVKAIPPERKYSVQASGEGYGKHQVDAFADDAEDGRLDVGRLTLTLANLSVSGIVVDSDDKPASGARLYAYGEGQPDSHDIMTDAEGKFIIEKVCPGKIRISANTQGNKRLHGSVQTEGGATDVKIVVGERSSSGRFVPKQPPSLVGKSLPVLDGLGLQIDPDEIAGKSILVCFWDMQQRPSRHCVKELAKQADQLKEKGTVVIAVQASTVDKNKLDELVKKYDLPFPVGMIEADEEKTKFSWGVKSLPWLILTDKKHIVSSNGFSLSELDEKMKEMAN